MRFRHEFRGGHQLDGISETRSLGNDTQQLQGLITQINALRRCTNPTNRHHFVDIVRKGGDDEHPVQDVHWNSMGRFQIRSPNGSNTTIRRKYDDRGHARLQTSIQKGKAFQIQHVDFIHKQDPWDQFCHTLINITLNNLIDFHSQLFCNLRLFRLAHLPQKA